MQRKTRGKRQSASLRPKPKFRKDIMRKLQFTGKADAETFKVLYAAVINGPSPSDWDEAERIQSTVRKFKDASEEVAESDAMNRTMKYRTPIDGAEMLLEEAEFKWVETSLDGFMRKAPNGLIDEVIIARKFLRAVPVVKPTKTEEVKPAEDATPAGE